jgi:hypothetical protein
MLDLEQLLIACELETLVWTLFSKPVTLYHKQYTVYDRYDLACDVDQDTLDREILLNSLRSAFSSISRLLDTYTA